MCVRAHNRVAQADSALVSLSAPLFTAPLPYLFSFSIKDHPLTLGKAPNGSQRLCLDRGKGPWRRRVTENEKITKRWKGTK